MLVAKMVTLIVTFDGNWQPLNLNASLAASTTKSTKVKQISFTPGTGNANACYIAGVDRLEAVPTGTNFGIRLPASASGEPSAPFVIECGDNALTLEGIYVKGTNTQTMHINMVVYP
jgi:hypothetical protein